MNTLLEEQIKKYLGEPHGGFPQNITEFLLAVNQSYDGLEHSLKICKQEKLDLNKRLQKEQEKVSLREAHLAISQHIANVGSWELELTEPGGAGINLLYWSDETFRILGFNPGEVEISNELFFSRVHPDDYGIIRDLMTAAIEHGKVYEIEHRLVLPGGIEKIIHACPKIIFDADPGKPVKMIGTIQDITAVKNATVQLEKTNHELHTLFENMQEGFFSVDMETYQMLQMSKACEEIWGYSFDDFKVNPNLWFDIVLEEDKHIIDANRAVMRAGKPFSQQYRIRHKNGSTRWLESKITPTLNKEGRLVRVDGMTSDITARREAEKQVVDSELRNRTFFEQNLAGVYRTTTAGRIITCNEAFAVMLGYAAPEELQDTNAEALYFKTSERDKFINDLRNEKKLRNFDFVLKCKDGSPLHVVENCSLFIDPGTGEEFCDGIMVNITELKKAEAEFYKSEKRYRQIVETAQEGIWTIDEKDKTNFVNRKICEILGYEPAEMMGKELYDFMDEEGKEYAIACMERRRNGAKENLDIRYVTKNGKNVWANISANPIFEDDGTYKGSLAMVTDITERKHQEELLQRSEANLRTIFDHADSSYILLDAELKVVSFNSVAETVVMQQNNMQLAEGGFMMDYFSPQRQHIIKDIVARVFNGETVNYEAALVQADGSSRWFHVKWAGVTNKEDRQWGIVLASTDITERKTVTLEHERITADLIQRNKDLQQFNYIVSHNLRAPVANIMGLSVLLNTDGDTEPGKRALLDGLSSSIKNLDEIIKDLNLILQVREVGVHEKKEAIHFNQLIDDIKISIGNILSTEKAVVNCNFEEADGFFAIRSYLYSIFYNLVLNGIKYRRQGVPPVINITSTRHLNKIVLAFEDNGKGIDIGRHQKDMFGLYKRFDTKVEGKGIGLFMVKAQVESLGGRVTVESQVNKGTTFRLELPV